MSDSSMIIRRILTYLIAIYVLFGVACVASVFSCWSELYQFFGNEFITLISLSLFLAIWGVLLWLFCRLAFRRY